MTSLAALPTRPARAPPSAMMSAVATSDDVLAALADRLLQQIEQGATSDTLLKLAEAYAWIARPDQPHGGFHPG